MNRGLCMASKMSAPAIIVALLMPAPSVARSHNSFRQNLNALTQRKSAVPATPASVRKEFLHAWTAYKRYAWGHDSLKPLSRQAHDWYGQSLWMTPVDALDTMILMGLNREARKTRRAIVENLSFDKDIYVQNFEITIRLLGGLLSAYQMTGDKRLLKLAEDLGYRLLPAFDSPTGIPYRFVNLKTGRVRESVTNPAEAGTLLIEFGTLARLTDKPVFYEKAKRALVEVYKRRSPLGLVGSTINVETGEWISRDSHIGGGIDSYYEYLLKCWLLFGDAECRHMWEASIGAVNQYLADESRGALWYGHADMHSGERTETTFGALEAFFPATLALSGDLDRAERLQSSCYEMWIKDEIEPEQFNYRTMTVEDGGYALRPEVIESAYYLLHFTGTQSYRAMGEEFFTSFVEYCRNETAYAALEDVRTKKQRDRMESFLFAETFKYFYLLFSRPETVDFKNIIFNTEAHPIKRTWK